MTLPATPDSRDYSAAVGSLIRMLLSPGLLDLFPDAAVIVNSEGTILQLNAQVESLFAYSRDEIIGERVEMLVPERYRSQHPAHRHDFSRELRTRPMGIGQTLNGRRKDGSEFPVEISLSPLPLNGETLVLSSIRDVTDRKHMEEDLRRAQNELHSRTAQQLGEYRSRLAAIVDSSEDAIISKNLDGNITSWNRGAERVYGYSAVEVVGRHISVIVPTTHRKEVSEILSKIASGESIDHYESIRVNKSGQLLNVSLSVSPIRDAAGNVAGASIIARDITGQKKAEGHLRQAQKMEAVGRLAGGLAHDFNNILGIISASTELLKERIDPDSPTAQYAANIREVVGRGAGLTRRLLAFSRNSVVQLQVLDLNDRLRDVSKLLHPLMGADVEIAFHPRSKNAYIEADPGQLDQIIVNLAVNARDAMPSGGKFILETGSLSLDSAFTERHQPMKPGKYVMLAVSDNGVGMEESILTHIFEPFFTTKEVGKGTGLGLATVYGVIKQMGGHIWVNSEPGRGTTFKIYPSAEHKINEEAVLEPETVLPEVRSATVLLVEDDEVMRNLTRQLLEESGFRVIATNDGKSALDVLALQSDHINVVLTDIVMPRISGPELVQQLSERHPALRVVYMSGYTGELIGAGEILKSGATFLEKPFTRAALLNAIASRDS